jgi:hypothetical protein
MPLIPSPASDGGVSVVGPGGINNIGGVGTTPYGPSVPDTGRTGGLLTLVRGNGPHKFQPDYDPAARSMPMLGKGPFVRGYIAQDKNDPLVNGTPLGLQFLYNPTEWEQDYSMDTSRYPTNAAPQGGSSLPAVGVPGSSTVSFNLIIDRTWDVNNPKAGSPYRKGIKVDVEQFEKMVGYTPTKPFVQAVALRLVFGSTLHYYGFVTNFSVLYSQFTTDMRCYRGGITGITLQILPDIPGSSTFSTVADTQVPKKKKPKAPSPKNNPETSGTGRDGKVPTNLPKEKGTTNGQVSSDGNWIWTNGKWVTYTAPPSAPGTLEGQVSPDQRWYWHDGEWLPNPAGPPQ